MTSMTIIITVVSLLFTFAIVFFVWKFAAGSMGDKKTLESGVPGTATVMSLEPTGMIINNMYYVCNVGLRVQLPAQAPYDVIIQQSVPITAMARVNPGSSVGVKVDPTDNTKVVIDWNAPAGPAQAAAVNPNPSAADLAAAVAGAAASGQMGQGGMTFGSSRELLANGQRITGVLTAFADTGNTPRTLGMQPSQPEFIDDPMYAVTLQLHIPNTAPLEAKVVQRVPRAMVGNLQMGMQLNCAVDPANPTQAVAIDWGDVSV